MRAVILAALLVTAATTALTQALDDEEAPVLLEANEVIYEPETERATARGSVMLARGGRVLTAERVVYDRRALTVTAEGDVVLVDEAGETYFADRMELRDDLRQGFIEGIAIRLADNSLLVARRADRGDGNITEMQDVTYTPCPVCPDRAPSWQINADTVTHDQTERLLRYEDATFEIGGVPILYTPYFQHPDPSVPRQSGFLAPDLTSDSNLGFTIETPYYWVLAPNRDVTIRPTFTTREGPVLALDLRDLQSFGRTDVTVSGTYGSTESNEDRFRGHIDARGRYDLGNEWDGGFDLELASDRTYLRRYNIRNSNVLTSNAFARRIENDRFIDASVIGFQTLRPDDNQGDVPLALPQIRSEFTGELQDYGARWRLVPDFLSLYRPDGIDTRRGSVEAEVRMPRISKWGDVFEASASVRGDLYAITGDALTGVDDGSARYRARVLPRATFDWRRPYARAGVSGIGFELEPLVSVTVAPTGVNDDAIPNEDSLDLEFDETNLLDANRFTGLDVFDEGSKVSWALRTSAIGIDRELWAISLGQSYRMSETEIFEGISGLENDLSDVVGSVSVSPHPLVDLDYRFRMGAQFDGLSKSDFEAVFGPSWLRLAFGHLLLDETTDDELARREEGRAALSVRFSDNWSLIASTRRDLDTGNDIRHSAGLIYEDPCVTLVLGFDRDFTSDEDAGDSTTIALRVTFRNLGDFGGESGFASGSSN